MVFSFFEAIFCRSRRSNGIQFRRDVEKSPSIFTRDAPPAYRATESAGETAGETVSKNSNSYPRFSTPRSISQRVDLIWTRLDLDDRRRQFLVMNTERMRGRAAFNHNAACNLLKQDGFTDVTPTTLPFEEIEFSDDLRFVSFSVKGTRYVVDNRSVEKAATFRESKHLTPLTVEHMSLTGNVETEINVINHTSRDIKLEWINYKGDAVYYQTIWPECSTRQHTYYTHVWRITDSATGDPIASYAGKREHGIIEITEEMDHESRLLDEE